MPAFPFSMAFAVILALALALALAIPYGYALTETPPVGRAHPAMVRLLWHLAAVGLTLVLGGAELLTAVAVSTMVDARTAEPLRVLPLVACACLAAALVLSLIYRLSLFLTPAGYERALDLAAQFGVSRRRVEKIFG
jgi:hypothetical protein